NFRPDSPTTWPTPSWEEWKSPRQLLPPCLREQNAHHTHPPTPRRVAAYRTTDLASPAGTRRLHLLESARRHPERLRLERHPSARIPPLGRAGCPPALRDAAGRVRRQPAAARLGASRGRRPDLDQSPSGIRVRLRRRV